MVNKDIQKMGLLTLVFLEVLAPQRPPAPPTEYFQLNLGGYDPQMLLKMSPEAPALPGYVGCMRGFQIGDVLIDLPSNVKQSDVGKYHKYKMFLL